MILELGITSIFVTHDQEEAIEVADEIMIISKGKLEQKGSPWEIYKHPNTPFVASFIGQSSIIENIQHFKGFESVPKGQGIKALIRPEYIEIGRSGEITLESATTEAKVKHLHFRGSEWMIELELGDEKLITYRSLEKEVLQPGEIVKVLLHRTYLFNEHQNWMMENKLKDDPMPVYI